MKASLRHRLTPNTSLEGAPSVLTWLNWALFDPGKTEPGGTHLAAANTRQVFMKAVAMLLVLDTLLMLLSLVLIIWSDLPASHPDQFSDWVIEGWGSHNTFYPKFIFLLGGTVPGLYLMIIVPVLMSYVFSSWVGLHILLCELIAGTAIFLTGPLAASWIFGSILGMFLGVILLPHAILFSNQKDLINFGIPLLLFDVVFFDSLFNPHFAIGFLAGSIVSVVRLPFYIWYLLESLLQIHRWKHPYCRDGLIILPIWLEEKRLLRQARFAPIEIFSFAQFLLAKRPLQRRLGVQLLHASCATFWAQNPMSSNAFFIRPDLNPNYFKEPLSPTWQASLKDLREWVIAIERGMKGPQERSAILKSLDQFEEVSRLELPGKVFDQYLVFFQVWRDSIKAIEGARVEIPLSSSHLP